MPELPEVENIRNGLAQCVSWKINQVFRSSKSLRRNLAIDFNEMIGMEIKAIERRARYLLVSLIGKSSRNQQKQELALIIHLGMSGRISIIDEKSSQKSLKSQKSKISHLDLQANLGKHDHFACQFSNQKWLIFNDPRRFGFVELIESKAITTHPSLKNLGVEPLSPDFNAQYLQEKLATKQINIKTVMMDNKIVVGVGNIYINESLFAAKISPKRAAKHLKSAEILKLVIKIKEVIDKAIKMGGSTISDYRNAKGEFGNFQTVFCVYGREGLPCLCCKKPILRIVQNGRSTFFCDDCQL